MVSGSSREESALQERFAYLRIREGGEWFRPTPGLLDFICKTDGRRCGAATVVVPCQVVYG